MLYSNCKTEAVNDTVEVYEYDEKMAVCKMIYFFMYNPIIPARKLRTKNDLFVQHERHDPYYRTNNCQKLD